MASVLLRQLHDLMMEVEKGAAHSCLISTPLGSSLICGPQQAEARAHHTGDWHKTAGPLKDHSSPWTDVLAAGRPHLLLVWMVVIEAPFATS